MDAAAFLSKLRAGAAQSGEIVHVEEIPARAARTAKLGAPLPPPLISALQGLEICDLYSHQVRCIEEARAGNHVAVVTSTASGKTLAYTLPVLEALLEDPKATALFLFPTKALAQDQLRGLLRLGELAPSIGARLRTGVYDGDTPQHTRRKLRDEGNAILSNPDMLHAGILPYHPKWSRILAHLKFVVVDEVHAYRGIFGSHVANVLRRLRRVCATTDRRRSSFCARRRSRIPGSTWSASWASRCRSWTTTARRAAPSTSRCGIRRTWTPRRWIAAARTTKRTSAHRAGEGARPSICFTARGSRRS